MSRSCRSRGSWACHGFASLVGFVGLKVGVGPARPGRFGDPCGELDGAAKGSRLVLGLLELLLGHGARDDPCARVDVRLAVLEDGAPDRDRGVEVPVVSEIADRAAVEPATL